MNFLSQENVVSITPPPQLDLQHLGPGSPELRPSVLTSSVMDQLHLTANGGDEMTPPKRVCLQPCSSSLPEILEVEQRSRWQQEEEDHRLAMLLQKELDQEERRAVDRRKGSTDAYPLRLARRAKVSSSSSTPKKTSSLPSAPKTSASKTSSRPKMSSTSSPSLCGGRKQATLTEMFSTFSS